MVQQFCGDLRILRVCMASSDPIETLHNIRTGRYSIITFLDTLELLDVQATMQENSVHLRQNN